MAQPLEPREIHDDEILTQYGFRGRRDETEFRNQPRWHRESDISMLAGQLSVDEAARFVRISSGAPDTGDGVRHTTAGALRARGFAVRHTPGPTNPYHVSVEVHSPEAWDEEAFEEAFREGGN